MEAEFEERCREIKVISLLLSLFSRNQVRLLTSDEKNASILLPCESLNHGGRWWRNPHILVTIS